jgi:archaellum biogenesis ATPase FlaH
MVESVFPKELLNRSVAERIQYFEDRSTGHPTLADAYKDLIDKIEVAGKGKVLLVFGPSGAGKSTLFKKVKIEILRKYQNEMVEDKGFIPLIAIETSAPEDGKFDWIDFYTEALQSLDEILIEEKRLHPSELDDHVPIKSNARTKRALRKSLQKAIKCRKIKLFLIDEAQHMTKVGNSNALRNHMETIKSLASKFGIPIILFGTYELLSFRNLSGQLSRRGLDVHFPRYDAQFPEQIDAFRHVLWFFQVHLPLQETPDLVGNWEYFYSRTIGCVGTLRDWIYHTLKYKLNQNKDIKTLTLKDFKKFEPTTDQAYKMAEEAIKGEELFESQKQQEEKLNAILKLDKVDEKENKEKKTNKKPGIRDPKRNKTGQEYLDQAQ